MTNLKIIALLVTVGLTMSVYSQSNTALQFDGTDDYAMLKHLAPNGTVPSGDFSVEAWISAGSPGNLRQTILSSGESRDDLFFFGLDDEGFLTLEVNGAVYTYQEEELWDQSCRHVAITVGEEEVIFYINGEERYITGVSGIHKIMEQEIFYTGNNPHLYGYGFEGAIDDVRLWKRVRSSSEIQNNYRELFYDQNIREDLFFQHLFDKHTSYNSLGNWYSWSNYSELPAAPLTPDWVESCMSDREFNLGEGSLAQPIAMSQPVLTCSTTNVCELMCNGSFETFNPVLTGSSSLWYHPADPLIKTVGTTDVPEWREGGDFLWACHFVQNSTSPDANIPFNMITNGSYNNTLTSVLPWNGLSQNNSYAALWTMNVSGGGSSVNYSSSMIYEFSQQLVSGRVYELSFFALTTDGISTGSQSDQYYTMFLEDGSGNNNPVRLFNYKTMKNYHTVSGYNGWELIQVSFTAPATGSYDELRIRTVLEDQNGVQLGTPFNSSFTFVDDFTLREVNGFPEGIIFGDPDPVTNATPFHDIPGMEKIRTDASDYVYFAKVFSNRNDNNTPSQLPIYFVNSPTFNTAGTSGQGILLLKYSNGQCARQLLWAKVINSPIFENQIYLANMEVGSTGDIFIGGNYYGGLNFGNGHSAPNTVESRLFVARFNTNGTCVDLWTSPQTSGNLESVVMQDFVYSSTNDEIYYTAELLNNSGGAQFTLGGTSIYSGDEFISTLSTAGVSVGGGFMATSKSGAAGSDHLATDGANIYGVKWVNVGQPAEVYKSPVSLSSSASTQYLFASGNDDVTVRDIVVSSNRVFVTGYTENSVSNNAGAGTQQPWYSASPVSGTEVAYLASFDLNLTPLATTILPPVHVNGVLNDPYTTEGSVPHELAVNSQGEVIMIGSGESFDLAGISYDNSTSAQTYLAKYDANLNPQWLVHTDGGESHLSPYALDPQASIALGNTDETRILHSATLTDGQTKQFIQKSLDFGNSYLFPVFVAEAVDFGYYSYYSTRPGEGGGNSEGFSASHSADRQSDNIAATQEGHLVVHLYPNPAGTELNIRIAGGKELGLVRIIDLAGRSVFQVNTSSSQVTLNINEVGLSAGSYILMLDAHRHREPLIVK